MTTDDVATRAYEFQASRMFGFAGTLDYGGMLRNCVEVRRTLNHFNGGELTETQKRARQEIADVINKLDTAIGLTKQFSPLLTELSIIEDPRLQVERPMSFVARPEATYFASYVGCNAGTRRPDGIDAATTVSSWISAIEELKSESDGTKGMIVPSKATYSSVAYFVPIPAVSPSRFESKGAHSLLDVSEDSDACLFRGRFMFDAKHTGSQKSGAAAIERLACIFRERLVDAGGSIPDRAFLVVVPFKRPKVVVGDSFVSDRSPQHFDSKEIIDESTEPAGCLFSLLCRESFSGTEFSPQEIDYSLIYRMQSILVNSSLREARGELMLRESTQATLAVVTHFLPTQCSKTKYHVRRIRDLLRKADPKSKEEIEFVDDMKLMASTAFDNVDKLDRLIRFALLAYKVKEGATEPREPDSEMPFSRFIEFIRNELENARSSAMDFVKSSQSRDIKNFQYSYDVQDVDYAEQNVQFVEEQVATVIGEAVLNSAMFGIEPKTKRRPNVKVRLSLGKGDERGLVPIWLEFENEMRFSKDQPEHSVSKGMGLQMIDFACAASSLPLSQPSVSAAESTSKTHSGSFLLRVPVASISDY